MDVYSWTGSGGFGGTKRGSHIFARSAVISYAEHTNTDVENGKIKKNALLAQL
ncbi:hypothetical protein ACFPK9_14405 [Rubritalea spongiae]|uniref:hypothetical protein n=1 Tax=Rubritalea spongiae TaxID=430797 RepID=UPI0036074AD9